MSQGASVKFSEPISRTLTRTIGIALVAGVGLAMSRGHARQWPAFALVALWFTLGGHWVEVFYLNVLRPRLGASRAAQYSVRIATWFVGGVLLGLGATLTAKRLLNGVPVPPLWLFGLGFVVLELLLHSALSLRAARRSAQ